MPPPPPHHPRSPMLRIVRRGATTLETIDPFPPRKSARTFRVIRLDHQVHVAKKNQGLLRHELCEKKERKDELKGSYSNWISIFPCPWFVIIFLWQCRDGGVSIG